MDIASPDTQSTSAAGAAEAKPWETPTVEAVDVSLTQSGLGAPTADADFGGS